MKLSDSFKILSAPGRDVYARALRAIGQDLATLFPENLEIKLQGETFIVRCQCAKERLEAKFPKPQKKGLKAFCADMLARDVSDLTRQAKSATVEFSQTYSPEEINRIDVIGMGRRFAVGRMPDIRSLGEMLRTIGRLVDSQEGRLVKVDKDARRIVFEYTSHDGKSCNEIMTNADLHKLQKSFYEKRGELVGLDPWKDRKFPRRE
jgi:hypothetical protein